jgi:hypothetical protein
MTDKEQALIDKLVELTKAGEILWVRKDDQQFNGTHRRMSFKLTYFPCLWRLEVKGHESMVIEELWLSFLVDAVKVQTRTKQDQLAERALNNLQA